MGAKEISNALGSLRPGAQWRMDGENYSGITWLDQSQAKPTEVEVNAAISAEQSRRDGIAADAQTIALVNRLRTASATQIDDYLTANVTNLAQARVVLGALIKVLALFVQTR